MGRRVGDPDKGLALRYGIGTVLDDADVRVVITVRPTRFLTYGPARA